MTSILAFDPGKCSGWALCELPDDSPIRTLGYGQIQNGLDGFMNFIEEWDAPYADAIVSESFIPDGRTRIPDLTPLKIEGAMRVIFGKRVHWQRNAMKLHAPDAFLKEFGFWFPGQEHARDAARHAIAYAKVNARHIPSIEYFWPGRKEVA